MTVASGGLAVIWIDWYSYHVARFRALSEHPQFADRCLGIELVGGTGVHQGMAFRDGARGNLPITTIAPDKSWHSVGKVDLSRALWSALSQLQPAAVLIPGYYTLPGIVAALWCRFHRKLPILMTESTEHDHQRSTSKEMVKRLALYFLFDRAVAGGEAHVRYLLKLGMKPGRIGRSYDTVDNQFFESSTRRLREETDAAAEGLPARYFLSVGRLADEKNVLTLIAAFHSYRAQGGNWELVIAGDGPLREILREHAAGAGLSPFVHFLGFCTVAELTIPYAFASCFVLPSYREPWGLVVNEAMASHLPVLVSDRAGCTVDLVEEGGNGWSFDPSDTAKLCRLLLQISDLDTDVLAKMGERSAEIIQRYSPEKWADEVARLTTAQLDTLPSRPKPNVAEAAR